MCHTHAVGIIQGGVSIYTAPLSVQHATLMSANCPALDVLQSGLSLESAAGVLGPTDAAAPTRPLRTATPPCANARRARELTFLSIKLTFLSIKLTFLSIKLTFLSCKRIMQARNAPRHHESPYKTNGDDCF